MHTFFSPHDYAVIHFDSCISVCFIHWCSGPNMGGKSTYLRQAAHIVILSHLGSFVPADYASLSVVDRLFSRVGASDDVTRDRSTFLVEMEETAAILQSATANSFVVVDEVGRGTSAVDGLAIAWAVLEHLALTTRCRVLFATHIHELTALALVPEMNQSRRVAGNAPLLGDAAGMADRSSSNPIRCMTMAVLHDDTTVDEARLAPVLTRRVVPHPLYKHIHGSKSSVGEPKDPWRQLGSMSFGVHVAAMAGVPDPVLKRASAILSALDQSRAADVWAEAIRRLATPSLPQPSTQPQTSQAP
jgi:hypothetical protein